ncbi:unnamed protein product [Rhizophagus irregularis]|nr:unnamed protein product [Rhizophagus irregularis]
MPIAISIKDLAQTIIERLQDKYGMPLPPNIEIPSFEWIRGLKVSDVQIGTLDDFKFNMLYTTLICADDKHKIPIEELIATSTRVRNRPTLAPLDGEISACDYDFNKLSLTPSVNLFVDISDNFTESFYQGQVYVSYKYTVFQPSCGLRHATELHTNFEKQFENQTHKPNILLLYTNGGSDHRTAPYNSWANPAERIISILNLALQNVALKRDKISDEAEFIFEKLNIMKEIREAALDNLELRKELTNSIDSIQRFLDNRTSHLSLHNQNFKSDLPAKDEDMKYFFEAIHDIESEISAEDTTAQDLKKHLNIQQFLKTHCQSRQYTFQIKKYNVITCDFCKPIKLPLEVFESLHFLPDPEPSISDKDHYKEFNTIYGTQTSDKYRPSCMAQPEASDIPKDIVVENVCFLGIIHLEAFCLQNKRSPVILQLKKLSVSILSSLF